MRRAVRLVDVFGTGPCTGNPLAVVADAEGLEDEQMRRFSRWSNLSEVTFLVPATRPGADYRVRIFSLGEELGFAGHPTLGTARAWLDAGGRPVAEGMAVQECGAGLIPVRIEGQRLSFAAPPLIRSGDVEAELLSRVVEVLGVDAVHVRAAQWLDNGPGWIGVLLDGVDAVLGVHPDASGHSGPWNIGALAIAEPGAGFDLEVRGFFSGEDGAIREDPVTGSLNASAAQWLLGSGRLGTPYVARQGTAMGRAGHVEVSSAGGQVWVGGRAEVVVRGEIELGA